MVLFQKQNLNANLKTSQKRPTGTRRSGAMLGTVVAGWVLATVLGLSLLWRHGFVAGPVAKAEQTWPSAALLPRPAGMPTLIMTVHPECPCSRASLNELEVPMSHCPGKLHAYVLFAEPAGVKVPVESTALWKSASQISGVTTMVDNDGVTTGLFGAETSGQVFVYDAAGVLRFSGGLTASRGHEGDNDGLSEVEGIVRLNNLAGSTAEKTQVKSTPVYGCKIW
jgi:hypothetical protein